MLSFWLCITRHAQITKKKFAYLCSTSRKAWTRKLIFLPVDKHKLLQIDSITLGVHDQAFLKHPKQQPYTIFAISQGKQNLRNGVDFSLLMMSNVSSK